MIYRLLSLQYAKRLYMVERSKRGEMPVRDCFGIVKSEFQKSKKPKKEQLKNIFLFYKAPFFTF